MNREILQDVEIVKEGVNEAGESVVLVREIADKNRYAVIVEKTTPNGKRYFSVSPTPANSKRYVTYQPIARTTARRHFTQLTGLPA